MNKVANVSIVAANVQRLRTVRKRSNFISSLKAKTRLFDIILLSETGPPDADQAQAWNDECKEAGFSSFFTPNNNTAIIWKESVNVAEDETVPRNSLQAEFSDNANRMTDITFKIGSVSTRVVAIYAPAYNHLKDDFFQDLHGLLDQHANRSSMIIGGDWNCVENELIDTDNPDADNIGGQWMRNLLLTHALTDVYRKLHPNKRCVTNDPGGGRTKRRLDRIYVSADYVDLIKRSSSWTKLAQSTHVPVAARFYMPGAVEVGAGKFKLGLHVMASDATAEYVTSLIEQLHGSAVIQHPDDPVRAWNRTKEMLLPHLQELSMAMNRFRRATKPEEYELQGQYGSALKSRVDPMLAGASSIFIRLRQVRANDLVPSLKVDDTIVSEPDDLLGAARDFFAELYDNKAADEDAIRDICAHFKARMPEAVAQSLEEDYTDEEMKKAVSKCKTRSSPGPDGLPVEFYSRTWRATGPILTEVANFIAENDPARLPTKIAHLHLLHKKGDHDQLANKRPISLINADERIISKAHNRRLAPLLKHIVSPSQTGFIPGRWIGTNIATMQACLDAPPPGARQVDGLMAVMDFEKAYDRLAYRYMDTILQHVGFGERARRWYKATYCNQTAAVFMNGWLSTPFSILSGVRQGDPLAPSLFAIFVEGFACAIRRRVTGLKPCFTSVHHDYRLKEMLFADDAVCGLKDWTDADKLLRAIKVYEKASGSRLSVSKCHITPIGSFRNSHLTTWKGWNLNRDQFRYLGIQVGVRVDYEQWWATILAGVLKRIRGIPMFDLPLAAKCMVLNTYCYSKVLYYDRFAPAPPQVIASIVSASKAAIWGSTRPYVSMERLTTPVDNGGFGLFDLRMQLDVARAQWIFSLLSEESMATRHLAEIRSRLCAPLTTAAFSWDFGDRWGTRKALWKWHAILCHPPPPIFIRAQVATLNALPARWVAYLEAWDRATSIQDRLTDSKTWCLKVLAPNFQVSAGSIPLEWFKGPDGDKLAIDSFKHVTTPFHAAKRPLLIPSSLESRHNFGKKRWMRWWPFLRKIRRIQADAEDTLHLLALNSLHPGAHVGRPTALHSNNRSRTCIMCLTALEETKQHLFIECSFAQRLWSTLFTRAHPPLEDFVCPPVSKSMVARVAQRAVFLDVIWRLSRRRRCSDQALTLISDREFNRIIRQTRARLAGSISSL